VYRSFTHCHGILCLINLLFVLYGDVFLFPLETFAENGQIRHDTVTFAYVLCNGGKLERSDGPMLTEHMTKSKIIVR